MLVRVSEQLVVVDLYEKRNLVRIFPRDGAKHAERRCHGIAAAFDSQLDDILGIEIERVFCKASPRRMLYALIDRKDRHVAGARKASGVIHPIQVVQDALVAVGRSKDAIHPVRARQVQELGGNGLAVVLEEVLGLVAEEGDDVVDHGRVGCAFPCKQARSHCRVSRQQVVTKTVRAGAVKRQATGLSARAGQPSR